MPARSLVQALEGLQFPCDRTRLIEYARRQELSPRSLDALESIPDRQYRDMTELFSALPSKNEMSRRRATVVRMPAKPQVVPEEPKPQARQTENQPTNWAPAATLPPVAAPLPDPEAADEPPAQPMDVAMQWWRWGMEAWPEWIRMSQRLWFPWMR